MTSDDIAAVVAFGGDKIGVMWSNQTVVNGSTNFYFAHHNGGDPPDTWTGSVALTGEKEADGHINLKADSSGNVYAVVKTETDTLQTSDDDTPVTKLLKRDTNGNWSLPYTVGTKADDVTRPILLLDEPHDAMWVLATNPCCNGGTIKYRKSSLSNINFTRLGNDWATFLDLGNDGYANINDVTSTKQGLTTQMGLVAEASDNEADFYMNNRLDIADTSAPTVQAPEASLLTGWTLGSTHVPIKVAWSAADPQSGVTEYQLQQSRDGGAWTDVALPSQTATQITDNYQTPDKTYQYRVRAKDGDGLWSDWSAAVGPTFYLRAFQENATPLTYSGSGWVSQAVSGAYGGSVKHANASANSATYACTSCRYISLVSTKHTDRGKIDVSVDNGTPQTVDLYSSSFKQRFMVFGTGWSTAGAHSVRVTVRGDKNDSSSGTRADIDAFAVLE